MRCVREVRRCSAASEHCAQNAASTAGGTWASSVGGGRQQRASGRGLRARGRVTPRRPKIAWRENAARPTRAVRRCGGARSEGAAGAGCGGTGGRRVRRKAAVGASRGAWRRAAAAASASASASASALLAKWLSPAFTPVIMNCRPKSRQVQLFALVVAEGITVCTTASTAEGGVRGV